MADFADDDFGDLYTDVEMQATSAISAIQALTGLSSDTEIATEDSDSQEVNEGVGSGNSANAADEKEDDMNDGQVNVSESGSESEDDFDIVLNDDTAKDSSNREKLSYNVELGSGHWINEEENGYELDNHSAIGGRGGVRTTGGHSPLHKYGISHSAKYSSNLEKNASIGVPSYSSSLNGGDREDDSFTRRFGTRSIVNQHGHNFSLPRSRTILDVSINAFDQKPWRHPGADLTDYFNFGLNEDGWKKYCNNLDRCRNQTSKVIDIPGYNPTKFSKDQEICSQHAAVAVLAGAVPEKAAKSKQRKSATPAHGNDLAEQPLEMTKGRSIEVEDGEGERLPSTDTKLPTERDSDVIIQIHVQDLEENCLILNEVPVGQSASCPHEASENEVACGDVENMLPSSSDGEDKSLKMEGLAGGTGKPVSERCLRKTSESGSYPVSLDSDKGDTDEHLQLTDSDSDGMAEAGGTFEEPNNIVGRCRGTKTSIAQSRKNLEMFHGKQRPCRRSSSPSETSKGGVCAGSGEYADHPKKAFTNSDSDFRDGVKIDLHSWKDSRHSGISSRSKDENNYFGRSYVKFHERKCGRMSVLENHLDDESAPCMSGGKFYNKHDYERRSTVVLDKQRGRMHPCVFHDEKDDFYNEVPKYSSNHEGVRRFNCPPGSPHDAYPRGRCHRDFEFDRDRGQSLIPSGKQHFLEQRISVMRSEEMEWKLHQREREFFVQEMDFLESTRVNELIAEPSQYFDSRICTQRKRKAEEQYLNRRTGTGDFIPEHSYSNDLTRDKIRSIRCHERVADYMGTKYGRHLPYDRRDAKSPLRSESNYDGLLNGEETICPATYDEGRSRYTRDGLSLNIYSEHQNASWGNGKSATCPRDGTFQRHGGVKRLHRMEHCRDSNMVNFSDDFDHDMVTKNANYMDGFARRAHHQKSEVLPWSELEHNSRIPYDCLQADRTPSPFDRSTYPVSGRRKILVNMNDSCGREKLVNGRELDYRRYRLPEEDESYRQFVRNPNMIPRENFRQMLPRYWGSSESLMVVGEIKSSRCFEAESLTSSGGFELLDRNGDLEKRNSKDLHKSCLPRIHETDNTKRIPAAQQNDRDEANYGRKFPAAQRNDYLDIEEGQIVVEDISEKPLENAVASKPITVKNPPAHKAIDQEIAVAGYENPRIKELLEKMEKRKERFKQPIAEKSEPEKAKSTVGDNAVITEAKLQRPARKRRWDGN